MIPVKNYYDTTIFQQEMAALFDANFQFAGMTTELANDKDFVCVDYYGTSVVVQNFRGKIKAFQNICTHRFNRIQTDDKGNRPLMCRYHGWTYDATGFPMGMPNKKQFDITDDNRELLCLVEYPVEICGKFVFFRKNAAGGTLKEQLGAHWEVLEKISDNLGAQINYAAIPHEANWKLLVENVLECYHCAIVHPDSFLAKIGLGVAPIEQVVLDGGNSSCHFPRTPIKEEKLRAKLLSYLDERVLKHDSFHHIYIFPNLFIASLEGSSFYVGHAIPTGPTQTTLRARNFSVNFEIPEKKLAIQKMIDEDSINIGTQVIMEDKAILENIQKAMPMAQRPGIIGASEVRIKAYMETYEKSKVESHKS